VGDVVAELEAAVADAGMLLVWAEKYRHPDPLAWRTLHDRLLTAGDRARASARDAALDEATAGALLVEVREVSRALRALIDDARSSNVYRRAVEAHAAADRPRLRDLLPRTFANVEPAASIDVAFWTPPWQRRGRPLSADAVADYIAGVHANGVPGESDDLTPGVDPELPGVLLSRTGPSGAPLALRWEGSLLAGMTFALGEDQLVVPCRVLRAPFTITLAPADEPLDEWVEDPEAYRAAVAAACIARGLPLATTPAASC